MSTLITIADAVATEIRTAIAAARLADPTEIPATVTRDWDPILQTPEEVRELENRVKRAVIMAEGSRLSASDLDLVNAGDEADSLVLGGNGGLSPAMRGVVIGQCKHVYPSALGLGEYCGDRFLAIAAGAVRVQINLHYSQPNLVVRE